MVSKKVERAMKRTRVLGPVARMSQRKRILARIDRRLEEIDLEERRRINIATKVAGRNAHGGLDTARLTMELVHRVAEGANAKRGRLNARRDHVSGKSPAVR